MGKRVLIVKNRTHEGPGLIEIFLKEHQVPYEITDLDQGEHFPSPKSYGAVIVLGGPDSANDRTAKIREELDRIRETLDLKIPYFGTCLGLQALVKAGGGAVIRSPMKEIGFRDPVNCFFEVTLTAEGRKDPLFRGVAPRFNLFHLHGETVQLKGEMALLGMGKYCENQMVRVGENAYGIQGHLELTREMLEEWMKLDPDLKKRNAALLRQDFDKLSGDFQKTARQLFTNFLKSANLLSQKAVAR